MRLSQVVCSFSMMVLLAGHAPAAEPENIFGIRLPQSIDDAAAVAYEDGDAKFKFMQWYSSYYFQVMRDELASSSRAIAQSGQYARVEALTEPAALSPHFIQSAQRLTTANGQQLMSYVLLRGQNGYFVKVRVTGPQGVGPGVTEFLKYVARDIGIENSGAPPAFEEQLR